MTGAIVGGLGTGGLVAGLRVGRSVGLGHSTSTCDAGVNCQNFHFFVFISLHVKSRIVC